jgi:hypothetical protein
MLHADSLPRNASTTIDPVKDTACPHGVEISVARDYRLPKAPIGYISIQADTYWAWWEVHQPDIITVHERSASHTEWMSLRAYADLEFVDGNPAEQAHDLRATNLDHLLRQVEGDRAWAGGALRLPHAELVFADAAASLALTIRFHPDFISCQVTTSLAQPRRIRRLHLGGRSDGPTSAIRAHTVFNAGPTSVGIQRTPLDRPHCIRPDWFTPPPYCFAFGLSDGTWMAAGLESPIGGMPYTRFLTTPDPHGR